MAKAESPSGPRTIAKAVSVRPSSLPEQKFVRRFLLHVLPRGFVRVGYYGLLAYTQRAALQTRCCKLLRAAAPPAR
jgi:hypothetical protein